MDILGNGNEGRHNLDLAASASRIREGGTWKKQRIVLIIPTAKSVDVRVMLSWWNLIFPPNQAVVKIPVIGEEVGVAYSRTIEDVLSHPELSTWEYILTIEHDNLPPPDGVLSLIKDMEDHPEFSCIGGLYWTKGEGGVPQIWGDPTDPILNFRPQPPRPGEIQETNGTGMGFNLWRMSMFKDKELPRPLFKTKASKEEGVGTQDLAFWGEAKKRGYRCAIDNRVLVGHMDLATGIIW